ncbi:hypothetical protein IV203_021541 [Nitzschia inconspicua]|uniref:Uncharacterized protein n=1 Tax=Nitzschia inconspicua TaxID=303405 RepID=A0A9K3KHP3_9STRA|nr:hypothetical protein IV203_021541 [Nitzschia inconspicua]
MKDGRRNRLFQTLRGKLSSRWIQQWLEDLFEQLEVPKEADVNEFCQIITGQSDCPGDAELFEAIDEFSDEFPSITVSVMILLCRLTVLLGCSTAFRAPLFVDLTQEGLLCSSGEFSLPQNRNSKVRERERDGICECALYEYNGGVKCWHWDDVVTTHDNLVGFSFGDPNVVEVIHYEFQHGTNSDGWELI